MRELLYKKRLFIPVIVICLLYFCLAFYKLDALPGEWFGDISNLHEYVLDIQKGRWPVTYRQGVGPLYHYAITPLTIVTGQRYIGYKTLSVVSGAFSLLAIYFFVKELISRKIAILTMAITATSFWFLVWARLGNLHAVLPGIVCLCLFFLLQYQKKHSWLSLLLSFFLAWSGVFWYLGTVPLPILFFCLFFSLKKIPRSHTVFVLLMSLLIGLFFFRVILLDPSQFSAKGYIGEKMIGFFQESPGTLLVRFIGYTGRAFLAYGINGDRTFRVNVPESPHIDPISLVFLLVGMGGLFHSSKKRIWIGLPILLFTLPSVLPSLLPQQIPSLTRTFASAPFIFTLVAVGLNWFVNQIGREAKTFGLIALAIIFAAIAGSNVYKYFVIYPKTLPNHNSPFGTLIARTIDTLPVTTNVEMNGCCWGDWGQPEPKAIYYQLQNKENRTQLFSSTFFTSCTTVDRTHDVVLFSRPDTSIASYFRGCFPDATSMVLKDAFGQSVATVTTIPKGFTEVKK